MNTVIMRAGLISDIHVLPSRHDWGARNLNKALEILAEKQIDTLIIAGDLAEDGDPDAYTLFWELLRENFGEKLPVLAACEGNHDCNGKEYQPFRKTLSEVFQGLRREDTPVWHKVIGDYDFIAFSTCDRLHYAPESLPALDSELRLASARNPEKPIFVITHFPPADTVAGSYNSSGSPELFSVLKKYPQVVSISGHTHVPLEDERCIWQGEFTAIQAATLAYGCVGDMEVYNTCGPILPFARECVQMLYMEISADRLEIHRHQVLDNREIAPDKVWKVALPYIPEQAVYTAQRKTQRTAPEFGPEVELLTRYDYGYMYLAFDHPVTGDFAEYYDIEISEQLPDGTFAPAKTFRYAGDYYRLEKNRQDKIFLRLPGEELKPDCTCRFRVYPVESFGKRGTPLEILEHTWKTYHFKPGKTIHPQE